MNATVSILPLLLLAGTAAFAQTPSTERADGASVSCAVADAYPEAGARYARPDRSAKVRLRVDPDSPTQAADLDAQIAALPDDVTLLTARAFLHSRLGEAAAAAALYQRALSRNRDHGHVLWSWGWSEMNLGRPDCALARWQQARSMTGISHAYWVGYSYAIAYWALGQKDLAVRWYDTAAVAFPQGFATRVAMTTSIGHWNDAERVLADQVFTAWQAAGIKPDGA